MKVNQEANEIVRSGDFEENAFKIKASAQAFQILSSGLYSNKIRAIIRELACNAADAHADAGTKDKAFIVKLPQPLDDSFRIRDFGTGLPDQDVLNLYTTYFGSNKQSSNDFTGCFGLGSKSPFAYTDTFTVESFLDGVKSTFTAFLAEGGFPNIAKVVSESTDEPNGLAVSFHVEGYDHREFLQEANYVFSFFRAPYEVVHPDFQPAYVFDKSEALFSGENWAIYDRTKNRDDKCRSRVPLHDLIIMGNVAYPTPQRMPGIWDSTTIVEVPIGTFDITPSRESISFTERSKYAFKELCGYVSHGIARKIEQDISNAKSLFEARKKFSTLAGSLRDVTLPPVSWQGREIKEMIPVPSHTAFLKVDARSNRSGGYTLGQQYYFAGKNADFSKVAPKPWYESRKGTHVEVNHFFRFFLFDKLIVKLDDCEIPHVAFERWCRTKGRSCVLIQGPESEVRSFLEEDLGRKYEDVPHVHDLSDIESFIKAPKQTGEKIKVVEFLSGGSEQRMDSYWGNVNDFNFDEGGFYVPIDRWKPVYPEGFFRVPNDLHPQRLVILKDRVDDLRGAGTTIYGVKKRFLSKFEKSPNWKNYFDYISECVASVDYTDQARYQNQMREAAKLPDFFLDNDIDVKDSTVSTLLSYHKEMSKDHTKVYAWEHLYITICGPLKEGTLEHTTAEVRTAITLRYPMLRHIEGYRLWCMNKKEIQDYVNLVDNG